MVNMSAKFDEEEHNGLVGITLTKKKLYGTYMSKLYVKYRGHIIDKYMSHICILNVNEVEDI